MVKDNTKADMMSQMNQVIYSGEIFLSTFSVDFGYQISFIIFSYQNFNFMRVD